MAQMIVKDGPEQTRQVDFEDASWTGIMTLQAPGIFGGTLMSSNNLMLKSAFSWYPAGYFLEELNAIHIV